MCVWVWVSRGADKTLPYNPCCVCVRAGPNAASVQYNGLLYTLFPERVNHSEADAACRRLPDGRLAQLDTQAASNAVGKALLPTLPMQVSRAQYGSRPARHGRCMEWLKLQAAPGVSEWAA
jgi:hypothetical protein